jgi:nitrite reductase/ring-hydroxylating ferredoxin subunit
MITNLSAVGLFAAARLGRRNGDAPPSGWAIATELCAAGCLAAGGLMGGTLVTRNQISVDHRYADAGKWRVDNLLPPESGEADVAASDELKVDQMKLLRFGDLRIALARTEDGYVAFDDRCTHKGGPLSDGVLACGTVQCPWHGSQFDVHTGGVRRGPAKDGIRTYEVTEKNGRVWINLNVEVRS